VSAYTTRLLVGRVFHARRAAVLPSGTPPRSSCGKQQHVGADDAPTRLIAGSHLFVPPILAPAGEPGMAGGDVPAKLQPSVLCRRAAEATGWPGDVCLCHPFIVHTAILPASAQCAWDFTT
jgi:hypothetical protein